MADEVKSIYQRLLERRAAVEGGDPTGNVRRQQQGRSRGNQRAVQRETAPTPEQRRRRIAELEAELAKMKK